MGADGAMKDMERTWRVIKHRCKADGGTASPFPTQQLEARIRGMHPISYFAKQQGALELDAEAILNLDKFDTQPIHWPNVASLVHLHLRTHPCGVRTPAHHFRANDLLVT
jgi:hypothetical protein